MRIALTDVRERQLAVLAMQVPGQREGVAATLSAIQPTIRLMNILNSSLQ
jgi:hypothetical protein